MPRDLQVGDLVLKEIRPLIHELGGKFKPNQLGSYIIQSILLAGVVELMDMNGEDYTQYTNFDQLKKYYAQ